MNKKYNVSWVEVHSINVEATTEQEAIEIVESMSAKNPTFTVDPGPVRAEEIA